MILSRPARGYVFKCPRAIMPACVQRQQQRHFNGCRCGCDLVGRAVAVGSSPSPTGTNCGPRFVIAVFGEEFFLPFSRAAEKKPVYETRNFPNISARSTCRANFYRIRWSSRAIRNFFSIPRSSQLSRRWKFHFSPPFSLSPSLKGKKDLLARWIEAENFSISPTGLGIPTGRSHNH